MASTPTTMTVTVAIFRGMPFWWGEACPPSCWTRALIWPLGPRRWRRLCHATTTNLLPAKRKSTIASKSAISPPPLYSAVVAFLTIRSRCPGEGESLGRVELTLSFRGRNVVVYFQQYMVMHKYCYKGAIFFEFWIYIHLTSVFWFDRVHVKLNNCLYAAFIYYNIYSKTLSKTISHIYLLIKWIKVYLKVFILMENCYMFRFVVVSLNRAFIMHLTSNHFFSVSIRNDSIRITF